MDLKWIRSSGFVNTLLTMDEAAFQKGSPTDSVVLWNDLLHKKFPLTFIRSSPNTQKGKKRRFEDLS